MLQLLSRLSSGEIAALAGAAVVTYMLAVTLLDPLRDIPGPFIARFSKLWYFYSSASGSFEVKNIHLHRKYGPIVRIAPGKYSIDDVDSAKIIYGHGTKFTKSDWYWTWYTRAINYAGGLFQNMDPHDHRNQKRKYAHAFSMSTLLNYEPFVDNCTGIICQRFEELAAAMKEFDMGHWMQCYAMDTIGEVTFGKRFGFLDNGVDDLGVFDSIERRLWYATMVGVFPAIHVWIEPIFQYFCGHSFVINFAREQVVEKSKALKAPDYTPGKGLPDQITGFIEIHANDPEKMRMLDIFVIAASNVFAGSDTTGITLSAIFYYLLKHPESYQKLQDEIDNGVKAGEISNPITFKEAYELKYLQAVMKEAMRLHPAVGLLLPRAVPAEGATLAGRYFPAKSVVGINPWVAAHNKSVWGEDADMWRPERWLEIEEQGRGAEVERYNFAFGMGSRTCLGKNISLLEMNKLVPQLMRNFSFHLGKNLEHRDVRLENKWFVKLTDMNITVSTRK